MAHAPGNLLRQAAAIPIRSGRVCLVMSSGGKRWVIPKGCIERGQTALETALQEAWEEAGLMGVPQPEPVGSYLYRKCEQTCHVTVFLLDVTEVTREWPESSRTRRWFLPERAATCVDDKGLRKLMYRVLCGRGRDGGEHSQVPLCWRLVPDPRAQDFLRYPIYEDDLPNPHGQGKRRADFRMP